MGKVSKLRQQHEEKPAQSRWQDENGFRKMFDLDKMPDGCDPDVWHLTMLYRQQCSEHNVNSEDGPIVYTILADRIINSGTRTLTPRARACITDTTGRPCDWVDIAEKMILFFFSSGYFLDSGHSIRRFCDTETYQWLQQWVLDTMERELLRRTAAKIPEERKEAKPRRDADIAREIIMNRKYTEDELSQKMRDFKSR